MKQTCPAVCSRFTCALFCFNLWLSVSGARDFYVDPAAGATGDGARDRPFATLEQARDAVRVFKKTSRTSETITIWLTGGDYQRDKAFELGPEDSGVPAAPVVWRAQKARTVRLLGGKFVTDLQQVKDDAILKRLPEKARHHVLHSRIPAPNGSSFPELSSRGFARPTTPGHAELFFNGNPMTLARWPNEGDFETIAGFPAEAATGDSHGGKIGNLQNGFVYNGDRPGSWQEPTNVWIHGYWAWDWANSYERIANLDTAAKRVKTAPPYGHYGFRKGQRIYFVNILEELDQPGEWFLNAVTGDVYFWPPEPGSGETLVSLLGEPFLRLNNVSHVEFHGITFEAARSNGIELQGGTSNQIIGCALRNLGNYAVKIAGGTGSRVRSCDIFNTGDGGVSLEGGDRKTLTPAGHVVENTHFRAQGRWSKCYVPAILIGGVGMVVRNNLIHDHPHCAILYTGNDHLIEANEIHHIALETGDVGAIYTGRDYTYRGNILRYNYIHHTGGVGMGSMGMYMDDCVSGTTMFANIYHKVQRAAFIGGGRDHHVSYNLFVDCNPAVQVDGRGLDTSPVWRNMVDNFMRDRLRDVPLELYRQRYPEMKALDPYYGPPGGPAMEGDKFKGIPPENNRITHNVCIGPWLQAGWHSNTNMLSLENNLLISAGNLKGPITENSPPTAFKPRTGTAAAKLLRDKIPFEHIGLYGDDYRKPGKK